MKEKSISWLANFFGSMSLLTISVMPCVFVITLSVGLTGYFSLRNGQEAVNQVASELRNEITARVEQNLRSYLTLPHQINQNNQELINLGMLDLNNLKPWEAYLWRQIQAFDVSLIFAANEQQEFVGVEKFGNTKSSIQVSNATTNFAFTSYDTNNQGERTTILNTRENYDPRIRPWYRAAVQVGKATWSDIYTHFAYSALLLSAVQPVYNQQNKLLGVLTCTLRLSQISDFLQTLKVGKTGQVFIIERSSLLVATSTNEKTLRDEDENGNAARFTALNSNNALTQATTHYLLTYFGNFRQIKDSQQLEFTVNGEERHFLQVLPLHDNKGLDWLIVVVIPEADFMERIDANTRMTVLLCVVTLIVAILIGLAIARWFIEPITALSRAAKRLANGKWQQQLLTVRQKNELGELTNSFNRMALQLKELFENLEYKVQERTLQLEEANQEITVLNELLKAENLRMSAELEVARRLQQMLLPTTLELQQVDGLEIAGFMEPATEAAGDYYDVLQYNERVKIGIGDVTGHGLESSILTVMVQMAVRTLLASDITNPKDFLNVLNRAVYDNVKRMNSDKNLTLSLIDYNKGVLRLSGQHEEILVIRKNGRLERIDTIDLGFPVGIEADIGDFIAHLEVHLEHGDGIVLYTDGVTEARNHAQQQYSVEQLCYIVSNHWAESAQEILAAVLTDLRLHVGDKKFHDDITLLILKQK